MVVILNHVQFQIKLDYVQDQHDYLLMKYYKLYLMIEELNHNDSRIKEKHRNKWKGIYGNFTNVL